MGRYFEIRSKLNGLILGVAGEDPVGPGSRVVMCEEGKEEGKGRLRGLWFEDRLTGIIRSRLGGELCLDVDGKCGVLAAITRRRDGMRWKSMSPLYVCGVWSAFT